MSVGKGSMIRTHINIFLTILVSVGVGIGILTVYKVKREKTDVLDYHLPYGPYEAVLKRPLDILLSGMALLILSPIILITAGLVRVKLGSPVLFTQKRPGLKEKIFTIYKFRTMTDERDEKGELLPDSKRLTQFGKWLRSTSLDELPELINIIKGDMSLVGPRPLLVEYLEKYNERQAHRHEVRPGLTGYAQVCGRNRLSWEERLEDDMKYVEHITFLEDLKIMLKTVSLVLKQEGVTSRFSVTMEPFMGNEKEAE